MAQTARYDEIADWYEHEFLPRQSDGDPYGIHTALTTLLGAGRGICLEIGCGTGARAAQVTELGWTPVGIDFSTGMLRYAHGRLPVAQADARQLPIRDRATAAVITVVAHTDMPEYPAVLREASRILDFGGIFVHVGVHPCFCGDFADRSDRDAIIIRPGYRDGHWSTAGWNDEGIRRKVGAAHWPLPELLNAFVKAGLSLERFVEGGAPTPTILAVRARKWRSTVT
jgi:SAM-dependent methyltransferase